MKEYGSILFSMLIRTFTRYLMISVLLMIESVAYASNPVYTDPNVSVEQRVQDLLGRLTLEEKAGFMSGKDMWFMKSVERLGIPSVQVTDCGHGVTVILDEIPPDKTSCDGNAYYLRQGSIRKSFYVPYCRIDCIPCFLLCKHVITPTDSAIEAVLHITDTPNFAQYWLKLCL